MRYSKNKIKRQVRSLERQIWIAELAAAILFGWFGLHLAAFVAFMRLFL